MLAGPCPAKLPLAAHVLRDAMVIVSGTWSTIGVNALLAGLIGVAATLLGSFTTYLFQSRTAERAQSFERDERLALEQPGRHPAGQVARPARDEYRRAGVRTGHLGPQTH